MLPEVDTKTIGFKALVIGLIAAALLVPLHMIRGLVSERATLREHAYRRIADGWGGAMLVGGPMLVISTERTYRETGRSEIVLLPAQLDIEIDVRVEPEALRVGIYEAPVHLSDVRVRGRFDIAALEGLVADESRSYLWERSRLLLPMSDVRTLRKLERATLAGTALVFEPSSTEVLNGIVAPVSLSGAISAEEAMSFELVMTLAGSKEISMLPLGSETHVRLNANWPHPAFQGAFLPAARTITSDGFSAEWQVLKLNRGFPQLWTGGEVDRAALLSSAFGVALYQPSDVYLRTERAIKHAVLFIALTFLTFFGWEQLSKVRLHPLQYLLVGAALCTFYLVLIALSENIPFPIAYGIAATALAVLVGVYVSGAVASRRLGLIVAGALGAVYGLMYVLVVAEDYALLLGAVSLFAALASVMLITRRLDWYRIGAVGE
jgi:inner membrane protein